MIARKLRTLVTNPIGVYRKYGRALADLVGHSRLKQLGHDTLIAGRPDDAIPPVWSDLWYLYRQVRLRKPQVVLEFGSGCSTVIIAQALAENARDGQSPAPHIYSVDAMEEWLQATSALIPQALLPFCTLIYSELHEVERHGVLGFQHTQVPDVVPNFLYLDGPALTPERQVAVDVLDMEARLPADFFMVIDGRVRQCEYLRQTLTRRYRISDSAVLSHSTFELLPS